MGSSSNPNKFSNDVAYNKVKAGKRIKVSHETLPGDVGQAYVVAVEVLGTDVANNKVLQNVVSFVKGDAQRSAGSFPRVSMNSRHQLSNHAMMGHSHSYPSNFGYSYGGMHQQITPSMSPFYIDERYRQSRAQAPLWLV